MLRVRRPHEGVDYAAPVGTPVWAVAKGQVIFAGWSGGFGRLVKVKHTNGVVSYYGHLSRYARGLRVGQTVDQKQLVGYVGMSGLATGPHLDFRLQNFSDRAVEATGLDLTLYVNGRRLARGVDNGAFHLDRLGETTVSAVVSTSLFEVARQLLELRDRETFSYELKGRVHLQGWPRSASFSRSGEISRSELARLSGSGGRAPQPLRLE